MRTEEGFALFVREHSTALLRTALLLTGDRLAAEELVQDTLVRLYPKWDRVQAADLPLAYVRRSVANAWVNQRRRAASREYAVAEPPERPDERDAVGELLERDRIWTAFEQLSDRQRTAIVLRFYADLTDEATAQALGCRVGTVRSLISRGLAVLREHMDPAAAGRNR